MADVEPLDIEVEAKQIAEKFFETLPKRLKCPKCGRSRDKAKFGIRVPRDPETGHPLRAQRQSYCKDCRAGKVPTKH